MSFCITASTLDPISHLKELVSKSSTSAPCPDSQRLLLKGKALVDSKLVKEYPIEDGSVLTLMLKPSTTSTTPTPASTSSKPESNVQSRGPPALTITTETNNIPNEAVPVTDGDISVPPSGPPPQVCSAEFHRTISDPKYWQRLHALCVSDFTFEDDADAAWETFLVSMKGRLSAGEAAKIRDVVGVRGGFGIFFSSDSNQRYGRRCIEGSLSRCPPRRGR